MNRKKCLETIQLLARIASADDHGYVQCVCCGVIKHYKDGMHGGHYISKGHSSYWSLQIENVHPQCASCNIMGMRYGTAAIEYTRWMQDYYGDDFVADMLSKKKQPVKHYKKDYEDMYKGWKELIKYHESRVGE